MTYKFVPHIESGLPSKVMKDLLAGSVIPEDFGKGIATEDDLLAVNEAKTHSYTDEMRKSVAQVLRRQNVNLSEIEAENLEAFESGAMTITTGHQLMVCGGTAFFEIKILSAIGLAIEASKVLGKKVVPVFWMASEDHDFEEIASFQVGGQKFAWQHPKASGAVGRLPTKDLAAQLEGFIAQAQLTTLQKSFLEERIAIYHEAPSLAEATRQIVRNWCNQYGVLVIDGDDKELKNLTADLWETEMKGELSALIKTRSAELEIQNYTAQVFPREINLFQLGDGFRERILESTTLDSEFISPNALMRPVYQELLLPNLAYVGGGGELAYWLQLGSVFKYLHLPMPALYLRDSVMVGPTKINRLMDRSGITWQELLGGSKESFTKRLLNYEILQKDETEQFAGPLFDAIDTWNKKMLQAYPEMSAHSEATRIKMEKLARNTVEQRYRIQKRRNAEAIIGLDELFGLVYPEGVFWERKSSYADILGRLGVDPQALLVDKMSTIKAGTHVLLG